MTTEGFTGDDVLSIENRFRGFPEIAHGGYTGGQLAEMIGDEVAVRFERPIPTETELTIVASDDAIEVVADGEVMATAVSTSVDVEVPDLPDPGEVLDATASYLGHHEHPYPDCFVCGPERPEGDGLRLFPGPVGSGDVLATPWTPHPNRADEDGLVDRGFVWSALDCPSIWAVMERAPPDSPRHVVTGELAVRDAEPVRAGEPHFVVAWPLEHDEGTRRAGAAVIDESGEINAIALHTLVVTEWGVPLGVSR